MNSHLLPKPAFKFLAKALEQMDMLGLFAGELQKRPDAIVVARKLCLGVIHREGKNEFFHQTEHGEILMAADLIENPLLFGRKKTEPFHLGQRLRHERLGEIQPLLSADDVLDPPVDPLGCFERPLISVVGFHGPIPPCSLQLIAACLGAIAGNMPTRTFASCA